MQKNEGILGSSGRLTKTALLWMKLTSEPLVALYSLLPFILRKNLHVSALQLSLFAALKPVLALLAYFFSIYQAKNGKGVMQNLINTWVLAYLPFLFFPWLGTYSYLLLAASCYQLFSKAITPPLMELLKQNLPKRPRETLFSKSIMLCFVESAFLGIFVGKILDWGVASWQVLFSLSSLLALTSYHIQRKIPKNSLFFSEKTKFANPIVDPLKESYRLVVSNKEFRHFQIGFMIGGSVLMFILPACAICCADALNLSHSEISQARLIVMAFGVLISSAIWKELLGKSSVNRLMAPITICFGLYPLCIFLGRINLAFFLYGVAQAGSHLIWNLSGTIFSSDGDSTPYTAVNILTQGIRGLIFPFLGGFACLFFGPNPVLLFGSICSFFGAFYMWKSLPRVETVQGSC